MGWSADRDGRHLSRTTQSAVAHTSSNLDMERPNQLLSQMLKLFFAATRRKFLGVGRLSLLWWQIQRSSSQLSSLRGCSLQLLPAPHGRGRVHWRSAGGWSKLSFSAPPNLLGNVETMREVQHQPCDGNLLPSADIFKMKESTVVWNVCPWTTR